jgi:tryptophan 2,3-dioxygenase
MNAQELKDLHDRERALWQVKEDAELDVALAKRNASARSGADGGDEASQEAARRALADAEAASSAALTAWAEVYRLGKTETHAFLQGLGLDPDRVRAALQR